MTCLKAVEGGACDAGTGQRKGRPEDLEGGACDAGTGQRKERPEDLEGGVPATPGVLQEAHFPDTHLPKESLRGTSERLRMTVMMGMDMPGGAAEEHQQEGGMPCRV